jgi:asparagine synthase (glutamine-hydrolysing)
MSIQFGSWSFAGRQREPRYIENARALFATSGLGAPCEYRGTEIEILYFPLHTTAESRSERQPQVSGDGTVLTWDGRLDNRAELARQLRIADSPDVADVSLVAAACEQWGLSCLPRLVGDWACSLWDPRNCTLVLAKDFLGSRPLYYSREEGRISWSSSLDQLVLLAGKKFQLLEEYIAGWLAFFPAAHLTPYEGIQSVPPSSWVMITPQKTEIQKYWDFDPRKCIRYRNDAEYEDHFSSAFSESVRRRLRSNAPVLAELSGGMDSSSVVCVADDLIAQGNARTPRLDTVSYYDDSEPNWNEKPHFEKVEARRGRSGCHIEVSSRHGFHPESDGRLAATPASINSASPAPKRFAEHVRSGGYRVVLSGIGGDETTGGVATALPEFQNLIASGHLFRLARRLEIWALHQRQPWFHLLLKAVRGFLPTSQNRARNFKKQSPWLRPDFVDRNRRSISGYQKRLTLWGALPSFQQNLCALDSLRRQLASSRPNPGYETRYPYLDRDLLEFLYAIPREQLVRPGERRSLMRRALARIVPREILDRRRKAFVDSGIRIGLSEEAAGIAKTSCPMLCESLGIASKESLVYFLRQATCQQEISPVGLLRLLAVECWLRNLRSLELVGSFAQTQDCSRSGLTGTRVLAPGEVRR